GPAMFGRQGLVVVAVGHERLPVEDIGDGHVGGVTLMAEGGNEGGPPLQLYVFERCVEAYAVPLPIQMRPLGHAGDIDYEVRGRQVQELLPRPGDGLFDPTFDAKCPAAQVEAGSGSRGQHGEIVGEILTRWDTICLLEAPAALAHKTARD